jgi:hypothetical protein
MEFTELKLIEGTKTLTGEQKETVSKVNNFLLKNKGLIGDFTQVKELVDRDADTAEKEIKYLLPMPMYLGVAGSLLVLVLAFISLDSPFNLSPEELDSLFFMLKLALLPGLAGLLFSLISWTSYRSAALKNSLAKKYFYDFLQHEMDQQLSHNITSSVYALQGSLNSFNRGFQQNMHGFEQNIRDMKESFHQQTKILEEIRSLDFQELSGYNIRVMQEIRNSTKEFERFNSYLQQTNAMLGTLEELNRNLNRQIEKTDTLDRIADSVSANIELNKQMIGVMHSDLREIDSRKKFMADAVINVDHALQKSLDELRMHTQKKLDAIRDITIREEQLLEKRYSAQHQDPQFQELLAAVRELVAALRKG